MVAALEKISEMAVAADKPNKAGVSPKIASNETLHEILGGTVMAVKVALGLMFHSVTGGAFLGDLSRKMDEEAEMAQEAKPFSSDSYVDPRYPKNSPDDPDDDRIDGYYRRGF